VGANTRRYRKPWRITAAAEIDTPYVWYSTYRMCFEKAVKAKRNAHDTGNPILYKDDKNE